MKYYTPDDITELAADEVFVFGSNAEGNHAGGAAKTALDKFGAISGQGGGLQGNSYAIPTMGSDSELADAVTRFIKFASVHRELLFYVTKIGCGIAGRDEAEVSALFGSVKLPGNIRLPESWDTRRYKFIPDVDGMPTSRGVKWDKKWRSVRGNVRTCVNGFHCSKRAIDALSYVPGEYIARVEVRGQHDDDNDKQAWRSMRLADLRRWRKEDSVALSVYTARLCLENFEKIFPDDNRPRLAIEAAERWIAEPTTENASAAWSAWSAAESSARSAAWSAAWSAAESSARSAAWSAAESSAESSALDDMSVWIERRFDELPIEESKQ